MKPCIINIYTLLCCIFHTNMFSNNNVKAKLCLNGDDACAYHCNCETAGQLMKMY